MVFQYNYTELLFVFFMSDLVKLKLIIIPSGFQEQMT